MPGLVSVAEFVEETRDDYSSPITSTFVSRMPQFRNTINTLEEVCLNNTALSLLLLKSFNRRLLHNDDTKASLHTYIYNFFG